MKTANWDKIVDQIRYWDAIDLVRNLELEMDRAEKGQAHCVFCPGTGYPFAESDEKRMMMRPEFSTKEDHLEISFPNLSIGKKDEIDIEVENHVLKIDVKSRDDLGAKTIGWFKMDIPGELDPESCVADRSKGKLRICLKRKATRGKRKVPVA